jgi:hypothetical protein
MKRMPELIEKDPRAAAALIGEIGDAQTLSFLVGLAFGGISPLSKGGYSAMDAVVGGAIGKGLETLE